MNCSKDISHINLPYFMSATKNIPKLSQHFFVLKVLPLSEQKTFKVHNIKTVVSECENKRNFLKY